MGFPIEFTFTLPCGYVDAAGVLHREGTMRMATAADEIAPLQDTRVRNNRAYLVVLILGRVITRLGSLEGVEITSSVIEGLFSADLTFLQEFYRRINGSDASQIETRCPSCGASVSDVRSVSVAPSVVAS